MMNLAVENHCDLHLSQTTRGIYAFILAVVVFMGTIGNSILGYYVIKNNEMQSLINILLASMAICDTLISCVCTPFDFYTSISGSWRFDKSICIAHSFVLSVLVVQNVTMFVIISVDRYFILVHKKDKFRRCHATILLSGCIFFSLTVSSPPLFKFGGLIFANEHCRQICGEYKNDYIYSLLYSSFLFVCPSGFLLLAYVHITISIRKMKRRIQPMLDHELSMDKEKILRVNVKFKQKTFSTILCLYAAAVICKIPLAISLFLQTLTTYSVCPVSHWIILLTYVNSAINPLIYALKISQYWMMLTGKFYAVKNQVTTFRRKSKPQNIYMISNSRGSVI